MFTPRYALFGGWRCNWEIGYNLPMKGFLYHDGDNFELRTVTFGYELQRIIGIQIIKLSRKVHIHTGSPRRRLRLPYLHGGRGDPIRGVEELLVLGL